MSPCTRKISDIPSKSIGGIVSNICLFSAFHPYLFGKDEPILTIFLFQKKVGSTTNYIVDGWKMIHFL